MRQKLITLSLDDFETASGMPNFSLWVRKQLQSYRDIGQTTLDDVAYLEDSNKRMKELLHEISIGEKEWIPIHGWMKCGEEE